MADVRLIVQEGPEGSVSIEENNKVAARLNNVKFSWIIWDMASADTTETCIAH